MAKYAEKKCFYTNDKCSSISFGWCVDILTVSLCGCVCIGMPMLEPYASPTAPMRFICHQLLYWSLETNREKLILNCDSAQIAQPLQIFTQKHFTAVYCGKKTSA